MCELWHHAGSCSSPRHNSWPGAVHVLPTSLLQPLMRLAQSFVLARPDMPDCPIVYASQRFLDLTGYPRCASETARLILPLRSRLSLMHLQLYPIMLLKYVLPCPIDAMPRHHGVAILKDWTSAGS